MSLGWLVKFTLNNLHCNLDIIDFKDMSYTIYVGEETQLPLMRIHVTKSCKADIQMLELSATYHGSEEQVDSGLFSLNEE